MDPTKFDELTKVLATSTSRRQTLKAIAAATLGGILGLGGMGTAFADQCKPAGTKCFKPQQCCSNNCSNGLCCGTGTTNCGGTCTNLSSDAKNCGNCGDICASGDICSAGTCINMCADGIKDGQETDTDCGGPDCPRCGNFQRCLVNSDCSSGLCLSGVCQPT